MSWLSHRQRFVDLSSDIIEQHTARKHLEPSFEAGRGQDLPVGHRRPRCNGGPGRIFMLRMAFQLAYVFPSRYLTFVANISMICNDLLRHKDNFW